MSPTPVDPRVSAAFDKQSYDQGEAVTVTVSVVDGVRVEIQETQRLADLHLRLDDGTEIELEAGPVTVRVPVALPNGAHLVSASWADTGVQLTVNGNQATGTA